MDLSPEDRGLLELITRRFDSADKGVHKKAVDKWNHLTALYHNYTDWRGNLPNLDRRDRDIGLRYAKREWGAELFIPYAFSTVETILPRMLSNSPTILVKPRGPASEDNVQNVKFILEAQQEQIDYELVLQRIARDALILGLGVQKVYWSRRERKQRVVAKRTIPLPGLSPWVAQEQSTVVFDDPMVEEVDPYDFFWDPFGDSMRTCEWVIHRTWRSTDYVKRLRDQNVWKAPEDKDITSSDGAAKYTEAWSRRQAIMGYPNFKAGDVHEVWEYHDGSRVITVLDRQWIVQQGANPAWHGEMPFQVYRPTPVNKQMVGKGEIEPIEDLQAEINTLRSQRRDNATFVLQRALFYAEGMIDPADFKVGPGTAIPVLGDPREVVFPLQIGDIPNSGVAEEQALQGDIERTTGIDDSLSGSGQVSQTATGVQLVQAAANLRIQMKTRNCEVELVRAGGRQMLALDQQKILSTRDVRIPAEPTPDEPDRRWAWLKVGPEELRGEFDIDVEGGSMAPVNVPQQRADARDMIAVANGPFGQFVDPMQALRFVLTNMGVKSPEQWIVKPAQQVPQETVNRFAQALQSGGVEPGLVQQALAAASTNGNGNGGQ